MLDSLQRIKNNYGLEPYSLLLFVLVSLSFKNIYKYVLPLIILIILVMLFRTFLGKISKEHFFVTNFNLLIYSAIFYKSIQTLFIISLLTFLVVVFLKEKPKNPLKTIKSEIFILIFFVLIVINSLLFEPRSKGIDKYLYLVLLPLIFILIKKISFQIDVLKSLSVYIASVLIASVSLIIVNLFQSDISLKTNTFFSRHLDLTHVYFGMFLGVAATFLLILYLNKSSFITTKIDALIFILFTILLIYIGARISLVALLMVFASATFVNVPLSFYKKSILLIILMGTFLTLIYKTVPRIRDDIAYTQKVYMSVKNQDKQDLVHNSWRNMYQRFLVTNYTLKKIKKEPLLGIGMQNVKKKVSDEIQKDGYLYFEPLNSHNQYLQIWVGMGVFAFIYFLLMLTNFFKLQYFSSYFFTFFAIIMLTESVLVRIKGISLFFLFTLIFSLKKLDN